MSNWLQGNIAELMTAMTAPFILEIGGEKEVRHYVRLMPDTDRTFENLHNLHSVVSDSEHEIWDKS